MQIDKLNTEQLEVAIQERDRELIIDFYATWCGPCVLLAKELEQVRFLGCYIGCLWLAGLAGLLVLFSVCVTQCCHNSHCLGECR